ncbi:MAG: hypothetical protein AAF518_20650, partial [Spirochaetota bacterium]
LSGSFDKFYVNYGYFMMVITAIAYFGRIIYLAIFQSPSVGLVWGFKIITDPFHDIKLYWKAPFDLMRGIKYEHDYEELRGAGA